MAKPDLKSYRDRMDKSVDALKEEFNGLRTGRANAGLLEPVRVEAYGSTSPLTAVAAISVPEPRMISVSVWDKGMVVSVEKAIRNANLGLNPIVDGQTLRIPIPPLTEERRKDLVKQIHRLAEDHKVGVREARRDALAMLKDLEAEGTVPADDRKREEKRIQALTDEQQMVQALRAGDNYTEVRLKELGPGNWEMWMNSVLDAPGYAEALFVNFLKASGAAEPHAAIVRREDGGTVYLLRWKDR